MSETSSDKEQNTNSRFDWGPPSNETSESFKEWLVYFVLIVILGFGTWTLLDMKIGNNRIPASSVNRAVVTSTSKPVNPSDKNGKKYFVQLGAFSDEKSAKESYLKLVKLGFFPTMHEPDMDYEIYRVEMGPFDSEQEANDLVDKLNSLEFSSFVVESQ